MTDVEALELISECKAKLGSQLVILGHHYQRDEIVRNSDFAGDSLKLSQLAAEQKDAKYIVFCGVHFMAESADVLAGDEQKVFLPDMTAGCSMADMADLDQVRAGWDYLRANIDATKKIIPVCYVNSAADIKAFCGANDGVCVTSSNCRAIFEAIWGDEPEAIIYFLPDQHLGRNTAFAMGVVLERMLLWNPYEPDGGIDKGELDNCKVVLWDGFCSVHMEFSVEQIERARTEEPGVKVIVHPECKFDVVQAADYSGSTAQIIDAIKAADSGSSWVVGTEINLVNRLSEEMAPKNIRVRSLSGTACLCETMYRINLSHLAWILQMLCDYSDSPTDVKLYNQIIVAADVIANARKALNRMLEITTKAASG